MTDKTTFDPLAIFNLSPDAQRLQSVMDEADFLQREDDIKRTSGERVAEQVRTEQQLEELQLNIERAEIHRIERDEMARLSARAKWEARQQAAQAMPAPATDAAPPAPMVADSASNAPACDFSILATREQLIEVFGRFTGMNASWFKNVTDTPALLAARKVTGQGGRGHIAEPWFCPFEVMQWLADSKRRKGRKLSTEKAWELLEKNFPKVHSAHSVADPRAGD